MPQVADRVKDTSTTTGTGTLTLANSAPAGFRTFASAFTTGATVSFCVQDTSGNWEVGEGVFTAPTTLTRTTVHSSSNAGALVNFPAGSKDVFCTVPATLMPMPTVALPTISPSLLLDFANSRTVDPRITFARASTATRVNSMGLIEQVAAGVPRIDYDPITLACKGLLIEESRTNLLTYSEQFDNAAWTKTRSSITANVATAPDGTTTADKLVEDTTASNSHFAFQSVAGLTDSTVYLHSVFAKAGERTKVVICFMDKAGTTRGMLFDLSSGTVANYNQSGITDTSIYGIQSVGNGWYRCWVGHSSNTGAFNPRGSVILTNGSTDSYTGDGTSGIYLWGAQLEAGAFATPYQPSTETFTGRTTTATYYGSNGLIQTASSGVARMSYNPANLTVAPKLLLEAAATNLLTYSEQFDNAAWVKVATATVTPNSTVAPDGATTADTVNLPASGDRINTTAISVSGSTTYTFSVWLSGSGTMNMTLNTSGGTFKTVTQSVTLTPTLTRYRLSITTNSDNTGLYSIIGRYDGVSGAGTATSCVAWGAQLEQSAYPTSYIPTTTAQVTRNADTSTSAQTTRAADVANMTGANFSSWYRQDEGTIYVDANMRDNITTGFQNFVSINDSTTSNSVTVVANGSGDVINGEVRTSGTVVAGFYPAYTNGATKIAIAYKTNDVNYSKDGAIGTTDTSAAIPSATQINIGANYGGGGQLNGHIARLAYYPKRISNTELQALTS